MLAVFRIVHSTCISCHVKWALPIRNLPKWKMLYSNRVVDDTGDDITWSTPSGPLEEMALHHDPPEAPLWHHWTSFSGATGVVNTCAWHVWRSDEISRCHHVKGKVETNPPTSQISSTMTKHGEHHEFTKCTNTVLQCYSDICLFLNRVNNACNNRATISICIWVIPPRWWQSQFSQFPNLLTLIHQNHRYFKHIKDTHLLTIDRILCCKNLKT